jgi:threonine/homoserine/homoserine lactone efflux protein
MAAEFATFLGVSALVIVTPGQDTALTIRNTVLGGRTTGVFTALGVAAGQAMWTIVTSLGLGALLAAFEPAFVALRLAGAAYLMVLGGRALWAALHSRRYSGPIELVPRGRGLSAQTALRQGLLSNLLNPKMPAFFTSLLPQFAASFAGVLTLGVLFCLMTLVWLTACTFAVTKAGPILRRQGAKRTIEGLTGAILMALGLRLATGRGLT